MMTEVRLFELACKGDRLDEINAEEVFNRQAKAATRRRALLKLIKRVIAALGRKSTVLAGDGSVVTMSTRR
ncbi:MAG: hypothetical protein DYG89_09300 [Caldilinea sp. CFX5]|nr:hypothetical protein [Caldilinea sp. CFX5]